MHHSPSLIFIRLFTTALIPAIGSFQDGGLRHNNPINLALWESRQIWNVGAKPDIVLSLGTGAEAESGSPTATHFRNILKDGFVSRLLRLIKHSLNSERTWQELINRLDESTRADYIRFNIPLVGGQDVRLDDVSMIDTLRGTVQSQANGLKDLRLTASILLVSTFYFELDELPVFDAGTYRCRGSLRCRYDAKKVFESLYSLHSLMEVSSDVVAFGKLTEDDICSHCHRYCYKLNFEVRRLSDPISIYIKMDSSVRRFVSGCPQPVQWFIGQQRLNAVFGDPDHGACRMQTCSNCASKSSSTHKLKKRKLRTMEPSKKKRKLI